METLETIRIQKLKQIRDLGYDPYPAFYRYSHTLAQVVKEFESRTAKSICSSSTIDSLSKREVSFGRFLIAKAPTRFGSC